MRILTLSSLYPNAEQPNHGVFVEQRLRHLLASAPVEARVVAPVPWFPLRSRLFGEYGRFARVPASEQRHGINIDHPRYPVVPKIGMNVAPTLMARALRPFLTRLRQHWDFDLIDAHYYYPDGVAAVQLGRWLGKPVVVTARGTDLNLITRFRRPKALIKWAALHSAANIAVCQALKDVLVELGVPDERTTVLRNGIDLVLFQPRDRSAVRQGLGVDGKVLLSVGQLIERKGHHIAIEALASIPEGTLIIVGEGPWRERLEQLCRRCGIRERVIFAGGVPHPQVADYYNAADVLVLASSREGMPNVVLEALACGTPVVATDSWGVPEVLRTPSAGTLVAERAPRAFAAAITGLLASPPDRAETRRYAEQFSWNATSEGQYAIFQKCLEARP